MYSKFFLRALKLLLRNEGGFSNHKNDKGGRTNYGITQSTYSSYLRQLGLPNKDVKDLNEEDVKDFYYNEFWKRYGINKIKDPGLAYIVFDTAVNAGNTVSAIYKKCDNNPEKFLDLRRDFHINVANKEKDQKEFLEGWLNRVNNLREDLVKFKTAEKNINEIAAGIQKKDSSIHLKKDLSRKEFLDGFERNGFGKQVIKETDMSLDEINNLQKGKIERWDFSQKEKQNILDKVKKLLNIEKDTKFVATDGVNTGLAASVAEDKKLTGEHIRNQLAHQEQRKKDFAQRLFSKKENNEKKFDENKLYSYTNEVTGDKKIFLAEMIEQMDEEEFAKNKKAIEYQKEKIGIPSEKEAKKAMSNGGMIHVKAYVRGDGTKVRDYYRSV